MPSISKLIVSLVSAAVVAVGGTLLWLPDSIKNDSRIGEYKLQWIPSGPMELPTLAQVDVAGTTHQHRVNPESPTAVAFNASESLNDGRWKIIVFGQVDQGPAQADINTFKFLKTVRQELGNSIDIWFVRLNRPERNGWFTSSRFFNMCGMDGRSCVDKFLILPRSAYDYSDVFAYIGRLASSECIIHPASTRINAVAIVDGAGTRHQHYGTCGGDPTAQEIVRGFRQTLGLAGSSDSVPEIRPGAYALTPTPLESVAHQATQIITIPVAAARKATQDFNEKIQNWVEDNK